MHSASHHAAGIKERDLAAPKLDNTNAVVGVLMFAEIRGDGCNAYSRDALDNRVLAKVPQGQVDIMDGAVDKDSPAKFGIGDKETRRVKLVAGLGAKNRGLANAAGINVLEGIPVRFVKATREATKDLQMRLAACSVDNTLRLTNRLLEL